MLPDDGPSDAVARLGHESVGRPLGKGGRGANGSWRRVIATHAWTRDLLAMALLSAHKGCKLRQASRHLLGVGAPSVRRYLTCDRPERGIDRGVLGLVDYQLEN